MATLTGKTIANTYKDLLQVSNNNGGVDGTLRTVSDGEGTNSPLQLSNSAVNINGTFQLNGNTLTATASALNAITDLSGVTGLVAMTGGTPLGRSLAVGTGLSVTNADGVAGNPTVELDSTAVVAGSYGPVSNFAVNAKGQVVSASTPVSVSIATVRTSELIADNVLVSSNVSVKGDVLVSGGLEVLGNVSSNHLYATSINVSVLNATEIMVSILNFVNVSVSTFTANQLVVTQKASVSSLNVVGKVSGTNAVFTGTVSANIVDASVADFNGRVSVGGAINVVGAVSGTSAVFTGIVSANEVDASIANFIGRVSVGGALNVTGAVSGTSAVFTGIVSALSFYGDGSNLTNLPTAPVSVSAYTVNVLTVVSAATVNGIISATNFVGGGAGLTNVSAIFAASATNATNAVNATNATSAVFAASATNATNAVNATNATSAVFATSATNATVAVNVSGSGYVITSAGFFSGSVSVSAAIVVGSGTVDAPSYRTTGDTNTGIYFPAADTIAVATSGTERLRVDSSGNVGIGTSSPSATLNVVASTASDAVRITQTGAGNALVVEDSTNPDSTPFVIDSQGRSVVGYTAALTVNDFFGVARTPILQVQGLGGSLSAAYFGSWSNSDTQPSQLIFGKSKSGTIGTNGVVASGTDIGAVVFSADDGTTLIPAAGILAEVDGTPGTNDMPGRLVFSTTPDGASTSTERMRINSAGLVGIGTASLTNQRLRVQFNVSDATATSGSILADGTHTLTANNAFQYNNMESQAVLNQGGFNQTTSLASGGGVRGFRAFPTVSGASGTVTAAVGYASDVRNTGAGVLTNGVGFVAQAVQNTGGGTLTNAMGFYAAPMTGATNNFGFYSDIASGAGRWNFYANGTAANYFAGQVQLGAGTAAEPALSTTGDTNTGIFFPAADTVAATTGGTERMRIDSSGNVGIATTSPSSFGKFAVQGASTTRAFYADALAQPVARYDDNSFISNGLTIRNTGVSGSNQGIGLLFQLGAGGTAVDSGAIQMRSEADYSTAANQDAAMAFFTVENGTNTERMRINSSGNVGIGTSSPLKQFEITKSARAVITSLTDATSISVDFNTAQNFAVMLTGSRTLENPANCVAGQTGSIFVMQNVSGGKTLSFGSNWKFATGTAPTLTTTASAVDRIDYIVFTSTAIHAVATLDVK